MNRAQVLEQAKALSLAGEYKEALAMVESLLQQDSRDLDSLRLKGNILELRVLQREANQGVKHTYSPDFSRARACYEQILLIQPDHPGALVDLGTHWKNIGDDEKAIRYFDKVIGISHAGKHECREELIEAMEGKIEILQQRGDAAAAQGLKEELKRIAH